MNPRLMLPLCCSLLLPAAAALPEWTEPALRGAHELAERWEAAAREVTEEFARMEIPAPVEREAAGEPPPELSPGQSSVECDGALLFDVEGARLVYIGNVRLRDARLQMRARHRLFVKLPPQDGAAVGQRVAQRVDSPRGGFTEAGSEAVPEPAQAPAAAASSRAALPQGVEPLHLVTTDAEVNVAENHLLLSSPAGGQAIELRSGASGLLLQPGEDCSARLLVDAEGNVVLEGAEIRGIWVDAQGQRTELTGSGTAYYRASSGELLLVGPSSLVRPEGRVSAQRCLLVQLDTERAPKPGFMQQFAAFRCRGVLAVHAEGQVHASMAARGELPAAECRTEALDYDARSGLCRLSGGEGRLERGGDSLRGVELAELRPDGSVVLRGRELSGSYVRPDAAGGAPLHGSFRTGGEIRFEPSEGCWVLPEGIQAEDETAELCCKGALRLYLQEADGKLPELHGAQLNLSLLRYRSPARAQARGGVSARLYERGTRSLRGELQAEEMDADLLNRAATLRGAAQSPVTVAYEGHRLVVTPAEDAPASVELTPEGDATLRGAAVEAQLHDERGSMTARCLGGMRLRRADATLETDGAAEFRSAQGVLTTRGALRALLRTAEPTAEARGGRGLLPGIPYTGLRELSTAEGGTVQSAQGSLRCRGLMRLSLKPEGGSGADLLQTAEANEGVLLAAQDAEGERITAAGDRLSYDAATGEKVLTGRRVILTRGSNTHTASGPGAALRLDAANHARLSGATQKTSINNIHKQVEQQRKKGQ